jgi:DNA-directed RNA polymerase subunit RPC12/RpoP
VSYDDDNDGGLPWEAEFGPVQHELKKEYEASGSSLSFEEWIRLPRTFCEWCEVKLAEWKRDGSNICADCDYKILAQEANEWERSLTPAQCREWQRARDAGVD